MENDEPKEPGETRNHGQGIEGVGTSTEDVDRRTTTPAPTNPSTSHIVDAKCYWSKNIREAKTT
jgi:hypothetical protein